YLPWSCFAYPFLFLYFLSIPFSSVPHWEKEDEDSGPAQNDPVSPAVNAVQRPQETSF
ncbi:hypothetical protein M9458_012261, partial [Cirrhinus mrigala]